jgi:hypothetical protein
MYHCARTRFDIFSIKTNETGQEESRTDESVRPTALKGPRYTGETWITLPRVFQYFRSIPFLGTV